MFITKLACARSRCRKLRRKLKGSFVMEYDCFALLGASGNLLDMTDGSKRDFGDFGYSK